MNGYLVYWKQKVLVQSIQTLIEICTYIWIHWFMSFIWFYLKGIYLRIFLIFLMTILSYEWQLWKVLILSDKDMQYQPIQETRSSPTMVILFDTGHTLHNYKSLYINRTSMIQRREMNTHRKIEVVNQEKREKNIICRNTLSLKECIPCNVQSIIKRVELNSL